MTLQAARCGHEHGAYLPPGSEPGQGHEEHDLRCTLLPGHAGEHEDLSFKPSGGSTFAWRTPRPPRHELGAETETEPEYGHGMLISELFNDRR